MEKDAFISKCGKYRYWLYRRWDKNKGCCSFIMLNPSTADASKDDPTIRRCIGYAKRLGYGSMYILNLFALRATDKKELKTADDPVGACNDRYMRKMLKNAKVIIAAWGSYGRYMGRSEKVLNMLRERRHEVYCLKMGKSGEPCHPLYLRNDARLRGMMG
ncbi:hypothetical protein COV19_00790 [Candidatus Woesearchaeota archaeon CG10_big_fil_rev_8_21_14_0_10_44_13]|nr:MAG: hypothetical protein COV19_00790 [Candidatus Woesearchaeota archaeon CG10_big_fil_rev_8_21_14_0_10_44_13]